MAAKSIDLIRHSGANILLVAMGNPKQELFIQNHLAATGCILGIGVGALFDFLAGNVPRAMPWIQRWRLEWVYRLAQEPRRLAGRYLIGNPLFLIRILRQWWSGSRVKDVGPGFVGGDPQFFLGPIVLLNGTSSRKRQCPPDWRYPRSPIRRATRFSAATE